MNSGAPGRNDALKAQVMQTFHFPPSTYELTYTTPTNLYDVLQKRRAQLLKNQLKSVKRQGLVTDGYQRGGEELLQLLRLTHGDH